MNAQGHDKVVLLEMEKVRVESLNRVIMEAILFFDTGATLSLCTHR